MIRITDTITLDEREIEESFVRASGPGGQNVKKVATATAERMIRQAAASAKATAATVSTGSPACAGDDTRKGARVMTRGEGNGRRQGEGSAGEHFCTSSSPLSCHHPRKRMIQ